MKIQRTKNAVRNMMFGTLKTIVSSLGNFAVRTVLLYVLGVDYVGLNSLFLSVLSFLSMAELGIGSVLTYSMYRFVAGDNADMLCALMGLYRKLYRRIGLVILAAGLALLPFIDVLTNGGCPPGLNVYLLYCVYLANTVISYMLFGYKQALLSAFQREDISGRIMTFLSLAQHLFQIVILLLSRNYYLYCLLLPLSTVLGNLLISRKVDQLFPQYKCHGRITPELETEIRRNVFALFSSRVCDTVLHASDTLVLSAFIGLATVGKYGNYYTVHNILITFTGTLHTALTAGIGNSLYTESTDRNYQSFRTLFFANMCITTFCTACMLCLYQPFMRIWVKPGNMLDMGVVFLIVLQFYIYQMYRMVLTYKYAAGIWHKDRLRPFVVMIINIVCNLVLVRPFGIHGVLFATVLSSAAAAPWATIIVFRNMFPGRLRDHAKQLFSYVTAAVFCCALCCSLCFLLPYGILGLILRGAGCTVIVSSVLLLMYRKTTEFEELKAHLTVLLRSRFKRVGYRKAKTQ